MTQALVAGLRDAGVFDVKHINTQVSRTLAEKGGRHQPRKSIQGLAQALRLTWALLEFKPDVVYLPLTNSPSFLGFLRDSLFMVPALLARCPLVICLHGGYYYYAHAQGMKRWWVAALLGHVRLAMVQGHGLRECFAGLVPADRVSVVLNGIDGLPFGQARDRDTSAPRPAGLKRVLFVGLLAKEKGLGDILAAAPHVPGAHFVFAGEWPSREAAAEAHAHVRAWGLDERVQFVGVVTGPAKHQLFASADIFVFPTYYRYEGQAISSIEALAAGLPIICTQHGAMDESVTDGWNGYFVPKADPQAVADRLNQVLGDDDLRAAMGRRSRELFEQRFTLAAYIRNWTDAIRRCLD
jgi:glycosyltransferase involved in cell wall biosynthesis